MRIWTYKLPFHLDGTNWRVEAVATFSQLTSRLYREDQLLDEQSYFYAAGLKTLVHQVDALRVELGYISWLSAGIQVFRAGALVYESHPGRDIHYGAEKFGKTGAAAVAEEKAARENAARWQRNKYSIYADVALGLIFYAAGKITGDLSVAAIIGAFAGLSLVVIQRFVSVDLLGGFAIFGTIMLLISAGFSLAFQSEFMVQIKSTVLGLLTAALFLTDGLLNRGRYFGARMQRYMPVKVNTSRMAIGLALAGIGMAALNYLVATYFSEDVWLNYTTFLDIPVSLMFFYMAFFWAQEPESETV